MPHGSSTLFWRSVLGVASEILRGEPSVDRSKHTAHVSLRICRRVGKNMKRKNLVLGGIALVFTFVLTASSSWDPEYTYAKIVCKQESQGISILGIAIVAPTYGCWGGPFINDDGRISWVTITEDLSSLYVDFNFCRMLDKVLVGDTYTRIVNGEFQRKVDDRLCVTDSDR